MRLKRFLIEKKKKKVVLDKGKADQKKALRIPTPPKGGEMFKDKKRYNRKEKHKKDWLK